MFIDIIRNSIFVIDVLLFCIIIGMLGLCGFVRSAFFSQGSLGEKRVFFFCINSGVFFLLLCGVFQFFLLAIFYNGIEPSDFCFLFFGDFSFCCDPLVQFFSFVVFLLGGYYLNLIKNVIGFSCVVSKYFCEAPALVLLVVFGLRWLLITNDLVILIVSLELITFASIVLLNLRLVSNSENLLPVEAAIKYFIFNGLGVGLIWLGVAVIYQVLLSINILSVSNLPLLYPEATFMVREILLFGLTSFFIGYMVKLGVAPFHQWVPDVYEGGELIVTALFVLLIGPIFFVKFVLLTKQIFMYIFPLEYLRYLFLALGSLSIFFGSIGAYFQRRIKRFIAFSSITHFGFMCVCLSTQTFVGFVGVFLYLGFYVLTNIVFFTILSILQRHTGVPILYFTEFKFFKMPILALIGGSLFSFAGLPPFGGFFGKLFVLYALVDSQYSIFFIYSILFAILINVYFYLRIFKIAFFEPVSENDLKYYFSCRYWYSRWYRFVNKGGATMFLSVWSFFDIFLALLAVGAGIFLLFAFLYLPILWAYMVDIVLKLYCFF